MQGAYVRGEQPKINLVVLAILGPQWAPGGVMGGVVYLFGQPKARLAFATPESETTSKMVQIYTIFYTNTCWLIGKCTNKAE